MAPERLPDRMKVIRRVVQSERIETQHDLVRALRRRGIAVTQATVSRDIKRLGLVKVPSGDGRYRYALSGTPAASADAAVHLRGVVEEFGREVTVALDLVLVKTAPGGAAPVAQAVDDMHWPDIAGTLAGEDTVIVVPHHRSAAKGVAMRLRTLLPSAG